MSQILIVDDDPQGLYMLETLLKGHGHQVEKAVNGSEALEKARRNPPEMIISDFFMPTMDGFALCRECKEDARLKDVPFIAYTATYTDPKDEELALRLGAARFLVKPIEPDVLLREVNQVFVDAKAGRLSPPEPVSDQQAREYSEALIRKLEAKVRQLQETNLALHEEMAKRRQAQEALRDSEQRLRLAQQAAKTGAFEWNLQTGANVWTPELEEMYGLLPGEFGKTQTAWEQLVHPEDRVGAVALVDKASQTGEPVEGDWRAVWPDGRVRWIMGRFQAFKDAGGKPLHIIGINIDITERKQMEEALAAAKLSAEQANQAKDRFLAVLSHELRTPLTPVMTAVSMLQHDPHLDESIREKLGMVRRNVELEAQLIDDLLDMTRITRGKVDLEKKPVMLCEVIRRTVEVCKPDIEARRLNFGLDLGPDAPYLVQGDIARLQQVFWNLLKNAIKFTPCGGCVGVRCRLDKHRVVAEVNDSGVGIDRADLALIFDAFEQATRSTARQYGGLGLGLAIAKAIVEMHGGEIEAQSPGKNKGATFRVRLPILEGARTATMQEGQPESHVTPPSKRSLRILLVEDHGDTAMMMQLLLSMNGHEVFVAGDVATALDEVDKQPFDLLLSDLGLPDASGVDLMRELRARGHTMPGIALSGYGQEQDLQRSKEAGFAAHLTKPASPDRLSEVIATVTGQARTNS